MAAVEHRLALGALRFDDVESHARMLGLHTLEQTCRKRMCGGWNDAEPHLAQELCGIRAHLFDELLGFLHPRAEARGGTGTELGECDAPSCASKQRASAFAF